MKRILSSLAALAAVVAATAADAQQPHPWQMTFQPAATDMMAEITWFEHYTLWFIVPITVIILLALAIPSFQLLTQQYNPPEEPKLTLKATGNQWNWDYEYQIEEPLSFNSAILADNARTDAGKADLAEYPRLLTVDNELVVPVSTMTRVLVTATDVIHAFAMPAFGIKTDAVPGRINEVWFKANKEGLFYGQCSELCGKDHAFMPIAIRVVSQDQYKTWLAAAKTDVGGANKALMTAIDSQRKVALAAN
jgi:cytochrome c oxidase subunit 2